MQTRHPFGRIARIDVDDLDAIKTIGIPGWHQQRGAGIGALTDRMRMPQRHAGTLNECGL